MFSPIFVATLIAIINPMLLRDVGYELSPAVTLGLLLPDGPFVGRFIHDSAQVLPRDLFERCSLPVGEYFLWTIAAQILVLPIIAYHFERISQISILANPLILPAHPPLMVLGVWDLF